MRRCHNVLFMSGMKMRLWWVLNLELNSKTMSLLRGEIRQDLKDSVCVSKSLVHSGSYILSPRKEHVFFFLSETLTRTEPTHQKITWRKLGYVGMYVITETRSSFVSAKTATFT